MTFYDDEIKNNRKCLRREELMPKFFMHYKTDYFPTKRKKTAKSLQLLGTYAQIFETVATLKFVGNFFANIVNIYIYIERWYRCKTYWCNKSCTTLILLPDHVIVINLLFMSLLTLLKVLGVLFFQALCLFIYLRYVWVQMFVRWSILMQIFNLLR